MIKIEVELVEVKDRQITKLEYNGELFIAKRIINKSNGKPKRKYTKKEPGIVGIDKSYGVKVRKRDIEKVKQAIQKVELGYKPTTSAIGNETGLKGNQLFGTLHYMVHTGQVTKRKIAYRGENKYKLIE